MATTDLLAEVLDGQGWYCIVGLKAGAPKQEFVATLEEASQSIDRLLKDDYDVYFACATYDTNTKRIQDNAKYFKAFWLDIDCGKGKPYADQQEGIVALNSFCDTLSLPVPTIVDSGRGVHAYWVLDASVDKGKWKPVAERLKQLCVEHKFESDPAVTSDVARILRVPETFNYKSDPPLPVSIVYTAPSISFDDFKHKLGVLDAPEDMPLHFPRQPNALTMSLMGNKESRFYTILDRTMRGDGCMQLAHIVQNTATISEPLWRAGLSVAKFCSDSAQAIQIISEGHPDYTKEATVAKASIIQGPYKCDKFEALNPGICSTCKYNNKIKSPIVLGNAVVASDDTHVVASDKSGAVTVYDIPPIPEPYFRGKVGGIYKAPFDADEESMLIYEHDLFVVKRLNDEFKSGECVLLRLHLPKDGVREFTMPASDIGSKEELRRKLAYFGVIAMPKSMDHIMAYVIQCAKELQHNHEAEVMRNQFGWADDDSKIILGTKEISADSIRYSPPSSATEKLAKWMEPKGSLEEWKKCVNVYNMPGFEPQAFGFFTAFGALFMKHINLRGAIINLINNESGTGKSTVLKMCNSVIGHPDELMSQWKDTHNHKMFRLGLFNNFAFTCDEVTKMSGDEFSTFAYAISQGHGNNRMKAAENEERKNDTTWSTIGLCSSNASFYDKLLSLKSTPDGEMMRLIEYKVERTNNLTKSEADQVFGGLYENYGWAGPIFSQWVVGNLSSALETLDEVQKQIDIAANLTSRERFYSGVIAAIITGGLIAKHIGLHDIEVSRVRDWAINMIMNVQEQIKAPNITGDSTLGEFINENWFSVLVVNNEGDKRTGMHSLPILEPRRELVIRIEPDTKKTYISAKHLRAHCTENQVSLNDMIVGLTKSGACEGTRKKRMGKGTQIASPPVSVYIFNEKLIDPDAYVSALIIKNDETPRQDA
jgi:hypothetical protein